MTTHTYWESVVGSLIRVHIIEDNGQYKLCGIGSFFEEDWYDLPKITE